MLLLYTDFKEVLRNFFFLSYEVHLESFQLSNGIAVMRYSCCRYMRVGGARVQGLALSTYSKKILGLKTSTDWGLSVWGLHVHPVPWMDFDVLDNA